MHVKYYNIHMSKYAFTYLVTGINIVKNVVWGIIFCEQLMRAQNAIFTIN